MTHTIASCGSGSSIVSATELLSAGAGVGTGTGAGTTAGEPEAVLSGAVVSCAGSLGAAAAGASDAGVDSDGASSCVGADAASSGRLFAAVSAGSTGSDDTAWLSGSLSASKAGAEDDTTEDAAGLDATRLVSAEGEALPAAKRTAQAATRAKALAGFLSLNRSVFQNQADRKNGQKSIAIIHHKHPCPGFLPPFWGGCGSVSSGDGTGIRGADTLAAFNFAVLPSAIRGFFL